jgi:DNA-binding LytR/AlgR family response regulator
MTWRVVIVDDEKPARDRLRRLIADHGDFVAVGEADDLRSAVALIDRERPDLCFLDVRMPEGDGFEVLRQVGHLPKVIFTTAYDEYAVKAFEVSSLDYLLKPFDRRRFAAALDKARDAMGREGPPAAEILKILEEIRAGLRTPGSSSSILPTSCGSRRRTRSSSRAPATPGAWWTGRCRISRRSSRRGSSGRTGATW